MSDFFKNITLGQTYVGMARARAAGTGGPPTTITGTETYKLIINGNWASPIAQGNIDGVTLTEAPNSNPSLGVGCVIDTSSNSHANWRRGAHYELVVSATQVDGVVAADIAFEFGIEYSHEPGRIIHDHLSVSTGAAQIQLAAGDKALCGTNALAGCIVKTLDDGQEREIVTSESVNGVVTVTPTPNPAYSATPRYSIFAGYPSITSSTIGDAAAKSTVTALAGGGGYTIDADSDPTQVVVTFPDASTVTGAITRKAGTPISKVD